MTKTEIKNLLEEYNLRPNRRLGQSFLIEQNIVNKIIKTAEVSDKDIVIEVGAGLGNLTQELARKAKKVIAIEKDKQLIPILRKNLSGFKNIDLIPGDILKLPEPKKVFLKNYRVVANIPYYLTSPLIRMFLENKNQPREMTLLVQKEVAKRITAIPRRGATPKMSLLAISVQFYAQPKIAGYVAKDCFWPKPKVDSAIIKIAGIQPRKDVDIKKFFQVVKAGFSSPRKQLINNLSAGLKKDKPEIKKALRDMGLDEKIRAEALKVEDWLKLYNLF